MNGLKVGSVKTGKSIFTFCCLGLSLGLAFGVVEASKLSMTAKICSFLMVLLFMWFIFKKGQSSSWAQASAWAQANVDIAIEISNIAKANAQAVAQSFAVAKAQAISQANNSMVVQLSDGKVVPLSVGSVEQNSIESQEVLDMGALREYSDILQELKLRQVVSHVDDSSVLVSSEDTEDCYRDLSDFDLQDPADGDSSIQEPFDSPAISLTPYPTQKQFGRVLLVLVALLKRSRGRWPVGSK